METTKGPLNLTGEFEPGTRYVDPETGVTIETDTRGNVVQIKYTLNSKVEGQEPSWVLGSVRDSVYAVTEINLSDGSDDSQVLFNRIFESTGASGCSLIAINAKPAIAEQLRNCGFVPRSEMELKMAKFVSEKTPLDPSIYMTRSIKQ